MTLQVSRTAGCSTAAEILRQASAAGVTLAAREGQILARPSGSLTPELKRAIAAKKVALLELLAESTDEVPTSGNGSGFAHFLDRAVKVLGGEILDVDPARLDLDEPHSLEANRKRIDQIPEGKGVLERRGE
jgi:hypothetical protein